MTSVFFKFLSRFVIPGFVLVVFVIVVYFWRSHDASNTSLLEPKDTKEILNNDILLELKGKSFVQTIVFIMLYYSNFQISWICILYCIT